MTPDTTAQTIDAARGEGATQVSVKKSTGFTSWTGTRGWNAIHLGFDFQPTPSQIETHIEALRNAGFTVRVR